MAKKMEREILLATIQTNLLSTEEVALLLQVTKSRLNKIKELNVVIRGFYLKMDVDNYINNSDIQERVKKHRRKEK